MAGAVTWTLERHTDKPPLRTNQLLSSASPRWLAACRRTVKQWRAWAAAEAEENGWEPYDGPVTVTYQYLRVKPSRTRIDCAAAYLLGKAMLDGLVDARVLPDDHDGIVRSERTVPHDATTGSWGVRLVMRELNVADPVRSSVDVRTPAAGLTLTGHMIGDLT
jgi:hypothetical protein